MARYGQLGNAGVTLTVALAWRPRDVKTTGTTMIFADENDQYVKVSGPVVVLEESPDPARKQG